MLLFSLAAALLCATLLGLVVAWLRRRPESALDQARGRYEAFVADLDRRVASGYVDATLAQEEKTEAARALLRVEETGEVAAVDPRIGFIGAVAIAVAAIGLSVFLGKPDLPDQPYAARVKGWVETLNSAPETLEAKPAAVALQQLAGKYGDKPAFWLQLGQTQVVAGDYYEAAQAFKRVTQLAPEAAVGWSNLGEALTLLNKGQSNGEARAAFAEALTRDGDELTALYYSARILSSDGRYEEARRLYGVVQSKLAADDGRQKTVAAELAALDRSAQTAATVQTQIAGMVAGLEARLAKNPEDPDGWARLLRSYRVLKNVEGEKQVLATLDRLYSDRPAIARDIVQRADQPVGAQ
ncbi:tetratricopeptide repeat protein [Asticcacaulis excentricus]|uniref:Cytochrome c-type biogenesis protein CcmI n=1 Tax=Asticcacaulis excentricus (strain ATCC 15261 / DSM 4724 / KCTC 12464 / NCIMB 9791 / VKM B-1370 / CB 48) TaxID=573065 RepID=E8RLD4_ASTEC|nr:cytochrome c-type biogenesis protein ccmi [Asticcacaulis excentricus]ADU13678.1 cytochrome c-type biogenesis protein CcmI [Asticcacaulis excentricus CB 48]